MEYLMRIGGREVAGETCQPVRLPFDGSLIAEVHQAGERELDSAVATAQEAARTMRRLSREERAFILRRAHALLASRAGEVALDVSSESGKPIRDARAETQRALQTLLFSAEEAHRITGEEVPLDASTAGKGYMGMTVREPLGVIAAITPFNFPLNLSMHKIAPALAAGNAVIHKPASSTPISGIKLAGIFEQAGLPSGAINVIPGPGGTLGDLILKHPGIAMVTFTGSPEVGVRIRSMAGMKKVTLELGNNSGLIIEPDAPLEECAPRCVTAAFALAGQSCISVQRIFVHENIREEFTARFLEGARALRLGHPHDDSTDVSSLISESEAQRVEEWIAEAVERGARLLTGGERKGAMVTPAVLADVPADARLSCKEAFGPVVAINSYRDLDEAITRVNDSDYGLQAGIYTSDIRKAFHAARAIHAGGILINEVPTWRADQMPYGGVKLSGMGREGPKYAIEEMTEPKLIVWRL